MKFNTMHLNQARLLDSTLLRELLSWTWALVVYTKKKKKRTHFDDPGPNNLPFSHSILTEFDQRFFPSEFGMDVDKNNAVEPAKSTFAIKAQIRRAVEAEGIPYTYVPANCFAGYFLPTLSQPGATSPPRDKVVILGDGNPKAVFNHEADIGTYTIKAVDDPRTANKTLFIRPPKNTYSFNELIALWEKLIGKTLEKTYSLQSQSIMLAISHSIFVNGDCTNFEIDPSFGYEASELYPEVKYTTVEEGLSRFV
ncbi:isoflavone reductase-like protein [Gossypium australe]|uniref:Isoflavone reductase-like protein n=1 Tax=Gossypium australe TaxID=47621 RepID=A0A5B6VD94_9ROSI|nr:isoflavone reductase-like protein [Gossypium australe]